MILMIDLGQLEMDWFNLSIIEDWFITFKLIIGLSVSTNFL